MFQANDGYGDLVDRVYSLFTPHKRGETVGHDTIRAVMGCDPHTAHWGTVMKRVRRRLETERNISTTVPRDVGYHLCTVEEQIRLAPYRLRRAGRQILRGERSLKALEDVAGLTINQRHRQSISLANLSKHRRDLYAEARTSLALSRPAMTSPRNVRLAVATQE